MIFKIKFTSQNRKQPFIWDDTMIEDLKDRREPIGLPLPSLYEMDLNDRPPNTPHPPKEQTGVVIVIEL